jgi:hypothetical protein
MMKLWSELPRPRAAEVAADVATLLWVGGWAEFAAGIYERMAGFAGGVGQLRAGGEALESAGAQVGEVVARLPVIGGAAGELIRLAFAATAAPFAAAGAAMESFLTLVAWLLVLLVFALPAGLWLNRYLPWRFRRIAMLQAADRVIRAVPDRPRPEVERLLASRALHRLSYAELRAASPDPFGDWLAGRYDRLARAEAASVGLRLR